MEEKQISFKVIKSGTNINDLIVDANFMYINLPNLTLLTYKNGSKELYSDFLAGVRNRADYSAILRAEARSDGCDCCASYYEADRFKNVIKWEILEIS